MTVSEQAVNLIGFERHQMRHSIPRALPASRHSVIDVLRFSVETRLK